MIVSRALPVDSNFCPAAQFPSCAHARPVDPPPAVRLTTMMCCDLPFKGLEERPHDSIHSQREGVEHAIMAAPP